MDSAAKVPTFVWANPPAAAVLARPTSAEEAGRGHVGAFASYYRMRPQQAADLELKDLHDTGRGAIIARFGRRIDGIQVFNEQISVAMDRKLEAVALSGYVTGDLPVAARRSGGRVRDSFRIGPEHAAAAAASHASGVLIDPSAFGPPVPAPGGYERMRLHLPAARGVLGRDPEPTRFKQVFFRLESGGLEPGYYVEVDLGNDSEGNPRYTSHVVSATDGRVLWSNDLTAYEYSYRVYADPDGLRMPWDGPQGTSASPHPTGSLDGFQGAFVAPQLVFLDSLGSAGVNDPWLPPGSTETIGNNVDAYADLVPPDGFHPTDGDFRAPVSDAGIFGWSFDPTVPADANIQQRYAAVTQLFYDINWFHDWYYAAGFTEDAGNAQFSNYGRGGVEGDPIRGEAQDSSGRNNANMSTPADGARPRMQMYLWDKPVAFNITVTAPDSLAGEHTDINGASFGPLNFQAAGEIVRSTPLDGCTDLVGSYTGKIVFVDRGNCGFQIKVNRAQSAGATAVIIGNVSTSASPETPPAMGGTPGEPNPTIGAVSLGFTKAQAFRSALGAGRVTGSIAREVFLLDGDVDNQIIAHEWGHYISNRLIFNSTGLQTNMARGLGEGWGDFHAMLITVREEDAQRAGNENWQGVYALASYSTSGTFQPNNYYFGIRRYPYSTDRSKNALTFKHISDANPLPEGVPRGPGGATLNSQVHNTGEIWATMLWECYASLLRDTLGGTPRLTFAQARDRMRDYLVSAYKMTPANPTLLEARDALLAAALASDPVDYQRFGEAFASRGAGVLAVAPNRAEPTNTPVVESYAFSTAVIVTQAVLNDDVTTVCNPDGYLDNGETGTLAITFRNVGTGATPATSATVATSTAGITFPEGPTVAIPPLAKGESTTATIRVSASGLSGVARAAFTVQVDDTGAGAPPVFVYDTVANADQISGTSFADGAETSRVAWSVASSTTLLPETLWQRATVSGTDHHYRGYSAQVAATMDLVSPTVAPLPGKAVTLSFKHRYSFEQDAANAFDGGVIEITFDGVNWTDIAANGVIVGGLDATGYTAFLATGTGNPLAGRPAYARQSTGYPTFITRTLTFPATFLDGRLFQIRFRVASDAATNSLGWEIDDVTLDGIANPPFDALVEHSASCNNQPIANAGSNQTVDELGAAPDFTPTIITLDGSGSFDADGDGLSYQWTQVVGPAVTLSSVTARQPTFTAPQVPRTPSSVRLTFQLVVNDGRVASVPRITHITVVNTNRPPVANAGANHTVDERTTVTLDGSASSDPDPDENSLLTYSWTQPAGQTGITLSSDTAQKPTFTAPEVTGPTSYTFILTVSDGLTRSAPVSVDITVVNVNRAPVANAGPDNTVRSGTVVTLSGSGTDPDGDAIVAYEWTAPGGITLSDPSSATPTFTAPRVAVEKIYAFSLVVTDALGMQSASDTVVITVRRRNLVAGGTQMR